MSTPEEETKSVFVGVRLPRSMYSRIEEMAKFMGLPISEVIRYLLSMSLAIMGPDTRLKDIIKDRYIDLLKNNPDAALNMLVIDALPSYVDLLNKIAKEDRDRQ
jgi:Arc/MetJ-type ribon-helix-helix transcriptional regulator